ncbi:hypothetical protein EV424DRAFT_1402534 [Suillus variegatus]|nr:hypothetical protein EV424DRAFT_1402534 [Suillus variegatus]
MIPFPLGLHACITVVLSLIYVLTSSSRFCSSTPRRHVVCVCMIKCGVNIRSNVRRHRIFNQVATRIEVSKLVPKIKLSLVSCNVKG